MRWNVCLGIESTAHTAGVGIVDSGCNILANEKHSHSTQKGGLIPAELAKHHAQHFPGLIKNALEKSGLSWNEIDCIAYSAGPGIGTAMSVGAAAARMLALLHKKPLVPVNHSVAHIEIAKKKCGTADPLVLYVSGGNTQVIGYESGRYRVYGETLDIGVGNLLDSFGRELGLGFPAGPKLDEMYFQGGKYIGLPYTVKGMDVGFSGLQTAAERKLAKIGTAGAGGGASKTDLAYSLMHTAFAMVIEVTERALAHTEKKELLLTGGVAASKALQEMARKMCEARGVKLLVCPKELSQDNGAMIAWTGLLMFRAGRRVAPEKAGTDQNFRTDMELVEWIQSGLHQRAEEYAYDEAKGKRIVLR